jgi:hypothetical protein
VYRTIRTLAPLGAAALALAAVAAEPASTARPAEPPAGKQAKVCFTCHKSVEPGTIRGTFDDFTMKSRSLQLKVDGEAEVLFFDAAALKVENAAESGDLEKVLKAVKRGHEVRAVYTVDGNAKRVTLLALKPKLKVAPEQQVTLAELEKLVALGPEKGKYFLFDARPAPRFADGHIPTAANLPFPAFEKEKGKLPEDRAALVIFYCSGVT